MTFRAATASTCIPHSFAQASKPEHLSHGIWRSHDARLLEPETSSPPVRRVRVYINSGSGSGSGGGGGGGVGGVVALVAVHPTRLNASGVCCGRVVNTIFTRLERLQEDGEVGARWTTHASFLEACPKQTRQPCDDVRLHSLTRRSGKPASITPWPPNRHQVIAATFPCSPSSRSQVPKSQVPSPESHNPRSRVCSRYACCLLHDRLLCCCSLVLVGPGTPCRFRLSRLWPRALLRSTLR